MSILCSCIKTAIKLTPKGIALWVVNSKLKGIVEIQDYQLDLDARTAYTRSKLHGEAEAIEVWAQDFFIANNGNSYQFILNQAQTNRPWLTNIMARIVGRAWPIPDIPQLRAPVKLAAELLKPQNVAV